MPIKSKGRKDFDLHSWLAPPAKLALSADEVHVWRASLNQTPHVLRPLHGTLASEECERAARFHFERDRNHFIAARGILRELCSRYRNYKPQEFRLEYSSHGKPSLAAEYGGDLRFNISHAGGLGLFAFSRGRELGIDLEEIRNDIEHNQIASHFFSESEIAALNALPKESQQEAFFICWTRKEAYIKAVGEGLSLPLHSFDVSLAPGEPARLLAVRGYETEAERWSLQALNPGPNYHGALVVEGSDWTLKCFDFEAAVQRVQA